MGWFRLCHGMMLICLGGYAGETQKKKPEHPKTPPLLDVERTRTQRNDEDRNTETVGGQRLDRVPSRSDRLAELRGGASRSLATHAAPRCCESLKSLNQVHDLKQLRGTR